MSREPVQKGSRGAGGLLGPLFLGLLTFSVIFIILELFSLKVTLLPTKSGNKK